MLWCAMRFLPKLPFFISLLSVFSSLNIFAVNFNGVVSLLHNDYALLDSSQNVALELGMQSQDTVYGRARSEFLLFSEFELTKNSPKYYDLGTSLYRFKTNRLSLSFGRFHPLEEFNSNYSSDALDALGANWVLNEQNPLNVRTSGWLGLGSLIKITKNLNMAFQYSPIFIPTLGPSISYSKEDIPKSNSPFARTPPTKVKFSDETYLPIRVTLDDIDVADTVLQNQYFLSLNYNYSPKTTISLFGWSAPEPIPEVHTNELLKVSSDDLYVLVNASPEFPRENNLGLNLSSKYYDAQTIYKSKTEEFSFSTSLKLPHYISLGFLHTFRKKEKSKKDDEELIYPRKDDKLIWLKSELTFLTSLKLKTKILKNLDKVNNGLNLNFGISYSLNSIVHFHSNIQVFTGNDDSYYGTWRGLDFITTGISMIW